MDFDAIDLKGAHNRTTRPKKFASIPVKKDGNENEAVSKHPGKKKAPGNKIRIMKNETEAVDCRIECGNCEKRIKKFKKNLGCKCKDIQFCSWGCRESSEHYQNCQIREDQKFTRDDLKNFLKSDNGGGLSEEYKSEQEKKMNELMKKYKNRDEVLKAAEEGSDLFAAWHIGCGFSNRTRPEIQNLPILARNLPANIKASIEAKLEHAAMLQMPKKYFSESEVYTDKLALKYFEIAAKGGLAEGMMSLSNKMFSSSIKTDDRVAYYWLTRAFETDPSVLDTDRRNMLDDEPLLAKEFMSMSFTMDEMLENLDPVTKLQLQLLQPDQASLAPNLAGLLLATNAENIMKWNSKTFNGGIFWPFKHFKNAFKSRNRTIVGRSGTPCPATTQILKAGGKGERPMNNTRFKQGDKGTTNNGALLDAEQVHKDHKGTWYSDNRTQYLMACSHFKDFLATTTKPFDVGKCSDCLDDAVKRVEAVAEGQFSISIDEHVPGYAYAAKYFNGNDGDLTLNTFKAYSQPEVCCILQCLMSNPADLHPLHLAEDPNLYWPLIWYYGSLHHALLQCCGEKTVKKIYGLHPKYRSNKIPSGNVCPASINAFPCGAEGEITITCGNDSCPEVRRESAFVTCQGCQVRKYCNRECAGKDWPIHMAECKKKHLSSAASASPAPAALTMNNGDATKRNDKPSIRE